MSVEQDNAADVNERLDRLEQLLDQRKAQVPRLQGVLSSFRVWTAGLSAAVIAFLDSSGVSLTEVDQQRLTWVVMGIAALLIISDSQRKIGA